MKGSVAIIGAGLGGLTAALALLRSGWHVRVYEQAAILGEVGAGITVSPGSGRGLASLGLETALLAASLPSTKVAFVHYRTGALLAGAFDDGKPEDRGLATARHIHRADLHAILLRAVRAEDSEAVQTGCRLASIDQRQERVSASFSSGAAMSADLLIAADGARSVVRGQMFEPGAPHFAGQVAFRCLVPRAAAAPFMTAGNAVVSLGPARNFHRYPIRGGSIVNVIGIAQSTTWQEDGWNIAATTEEFLAEFGSFHDDVVGLIKQSPADSLIKWGLFVRPPVKRWSIGRVALLGDAAHPILPFLGLGAALAIEDGIVLARALNDAPDPATAFAVYERTRVDRVALVRQRTILQGELIQASDPDAGLLAQAPARLLPSLFEYDPATVTLARLATE